MPAPTPKARMPNRCLALATAPPAAGVPLGAQPGLGPPFSQPARVSLGPGCISGLRRAARRTISRGPFAPTLAPMQTVQPSRIGGAGSVPGFSQLPHAATLLGADPSEAAHPNARRCALGTPALGAAPRRLPGAGRNDCRRACGAVEFRGPSAPASLPEQKARPPRKARILPAPKASRR